MKEKDKNNILSAIMDIKNVLHDSGEKYYEDSFDKYYNALYNAKSDKEYQAAIRCCLRIFSGGMGSYNDMVLYKEGSPNKENNNILKILNKKLYLMLTKAIA